MHAMYTMIDGFKGWMKPGPRTMNSCIKVDRALVAVLACWIVVTWALLA